MAVRLLQKSYNRLLKKLPLASDRRELRFVRAGIAQSVLFFSIFLWFGRYGFRRRRFGRSRFVYGRTIPLFRLIAYYRFLVDRRFIRLIRARFRLYDFRRFCKGIVLQFGFFLFVLVFIFFFISNVRANRCYGSGRTDKVCIRNFLYSIDHEIVPDA